MVDTNKGAEISLPIYMDYQATTPVDPRVIEAMMPYLTSNFGNPHSLAHSFGWQAEAAVERARKQVAALIGAEPREIFFTSGATESNNLAIKGVARHYRSRKDHVITAATEHKCVLESAHALTHEGFAVDYLGVDGDGLIDVAALDQAIGARTVLVSVMAVNNEIGVIQPLADIGALCRRHGVFFHCDAAQGVGKIELDVDAMNIDLMSISGHKIYAPKGIGALYVRHRPRVKLAPLLSGGGQERGLRPGTLAPAQCVALGEACRLAGDEMAADGARVAGQARQFIDEVRRRLPDVGLNGHADQRYAGNINLSFGDVSADLLIAGMGDLAVSSAAACASAVKEPSYVLEAIGLGKRQAAASIRFGIGRFTTDAEISYAVDALCDHVTRLRADSRRTG